MGIRKLKVGKALNRLGETYWGELRVLLNCEPPKVCNVIDNLDYVFSGRLYFIMRFTVCCGIAELKDNDMEYHYFNGYFDINEGDRAEQFIEQIHYMYYKSNMCVEDIGTYMEITE